LGGLSLVRQNIVQELCTCAEAVKQLIIRVCSWMSLTAHELCNQDCQTCTKSNSSWPTRDGISYIHIHSEDKHDTRHGRSESCHM